MVRHHRSRTPGVQGTSNPGRGGRGRAKKVGAQRGSVGGPPRRCAPPAALHYLHENPEEQGSHPDLDGQLPHGVARAAPAAAVGALRGSRSSAGAGSPTLGGEGGALQAAGGGGRRAPGGGGQTGGGEGSGKPARAQGSGTLHCCPGPASARSVGAPRGLPAPSRQEPPPRPGPTLCTGGQGRSPGKPRRRPCALCAPTLPSHWAATGLPAPAARSRGFACGPSASPGSTTDSGSRSLAPCTHARTWACSIRESLGILSGSGQPWRPLSNVNFFLSFYFFFFPEAP